MTKMEPVHFLERSRDGARILCCEPTEHVRVSYSIVNANVTCTLCRNLLGAAPTAPFMSPEAFAKSTLNCITLSADAAEGWLSVTHPGQFVRATEPDPCAPNERTPVGWLLALLTAAQDEAKRLTRERDAARAEVEAQESEVRGLRANLAAALASRDAATGKAGDMVKVVDADLQVFIQIGKLLGLGDGEAPWRAAVPKIEALQADLAAALARAEKAERNAEAHAVGREVLRNTVQTLAQERDAALARAEKLSDTLCANNTEAAGIKIERDALRASVQALNEKLDAACPQRCVKCSNTATGLVSSWCAHCWRAAYDEEATKNIIQSNTIASTNMELRRIDTILAGRPALNKPTRAENIEHAIATAAKCDTALARVDQLAAVLECVRGAWPNGVGAPTMGRIMSLLAETKVTK